MEFFKNLCVYERREAQTQRWHLPVLNCTGHIERLFPIAKRRFCIGDDKTARRSHSQSVLRTLKDRKIDIVFQLSNLMAQR